MRFHLDVAILSQPIAPPLPNSFELIRNRDFQRPARAATIKNNRGYRNDFGGKQTFIEPSY
jgi:hypothetical protein